MDILLIGRENRVTQTLNELFDTYDYISVKSLTPADLTDIKSGSHSRSDVIIADLAAFEIPAPDAVRYLKKLNLSHSLLVTTIYKNKRLIQSLLNAGADAHLPIDTTEQKLFAVLADLNDK